MIIADYLLNRCRYADLQHRALLFPLTDCYSFRRALGIAAGHYVPGIVPVNLRTRRRLQLYPAESTFQPRC